MLTNIENRLEELFEKIEKMPPEKVEEAEKVRVCLNCTCVTFYVELHTMEYIDLLCMISYLLAGKGEIAPLAGP